ncbi:MAG: mandelate racemase/muconate lactonizing enzyme family protein [Roseiflexaceae bacterium]|nr:mandelate racemase/muconate lactonizing enzyme family protein [Roseiflexaceae bacterium]
MPIKYIKAFPLRYPEPNDHNNTRYIMLVRVETDDGIIGWGEAITMWPEASRAAKIVVEDGLAPMLIGRDPCDTYGIWLAMKEHTWWYGEGGIASFAVSALDIAMWDLKGKILGVPLYQLLGGKVHDRLRACVSTHPSKPTINEMAQELAEHIERGYTALKVGFGKKGEARLGFEPKRDIAFVQAVREAIGDEVDFMVDYGHPVRMEVTQAIRMAREFERFNIRWIEDPLRTLDWEGYAQLRAAIQIQIATGEDLWTIADYRRLVRAGFADVVLVDPGRAEGITAYLKVQELTAHAYQYIDAHAWSSAIITAASVHLTACASNYIIMELKPFPNPMQHELVSEPFEQQGGWIAVPTKPGLGIEVDESVVQKYAHD